MSTVQKSTRKSVIERKTRETEIYLELNLDGAGQYDVETGIGFFNHMLESFAKHALFDLTLRAKGDLQVDDHHAVEDVGICLGQAIRQALGGAEGLRRFGFFVLPMGEAKAESAVDVSNRPFFVYNVEVQNLRAGDFDISLVEEFFGALSQSAGLDLHIELRYGKNPHHVAEAIFKATARALKMALEIDPRVQGVPSVKGTL